MLTPGYLPLYGGIETVVDTLSKELVKNGINIHILTRPYPKCKNYSIENGMKITRTDLLNIVDKEVFADHNLEFHEFFTNYLKDNDIDIIHGHMIYDFGLPLAYMVNSAAVNMKVPIILHQHSPLESPEFAFALRTFKWDGIVCVSRWLARQVYDSGIAPERIETMLNFIDTEKFKPNSHDLRIKKNLIDKLDIDDANLTILIPSRILKRDGTPDERKHLDIVIHGLSHLSKERNFTAIITAAGDRNYQKETKEEKMKLQELAEVFEVDDKVRIPKDEIMQSEMPALYSLSDIVALPSTREAFGMVYIEGMASGKPAIGAISGGVPEVIMHNKTGILVKPDSAFELFLAFKKFFENKDLIKQYGKNGRNVVEKVYSASKNVKAFLNLYKKIIK